MLNIARYTKGALTLEQLLNIEPWEYMVIKKAVDNLIEAEKKEYKKKH